MSGPPPGIDISGMSGGPPPGVDMGASRGYVDPNFPNPGGPKDIPVIVYGYTPNFALAVLGVVLFLVLTVVHGWLSFRPRKTLYSLPLPIATLVEVIGYIARLFSAKKSPYNIIYYIIQYFFIVVAPVILAAGIYVILSKLIALLGRQYSPLLKPRTILITFITADVVATILQIAGAAMIGAAESEGKDSSTANNILLAGLACQVFTFAIFLGLLALFMKKTATVVRDYPGLRLFQWSIVVASLLVFLRTIFRLVETAEGVLGYLSSNEVFFGTLEFAPIVVAIMVMAIWHPGKYIEGREHKGTENEGDYEMTA